MHARGVELVAEVRAPRAGADLVIGPEHDVVGEELRAPVEELGKGLLPVLGVELVLLLDGHPGKPAPLLGHPLAELRVLGLELREFVASRLPVLAGSDLLLGHRSHPLAVRPFSLKAGPSTRVRATLTRLAQPPRAKEAAWLSVSASSSPGSARRSTTRSTSTSIR